MPAPTVLSNRPSLTLGLSLVLGLSGLACTDAEPLPDAAGPPGSVVRSSGLWWALDRQDSWEAVEPLLGHIPPHGLLLGGELAPSFAGTAPGGAGRDAGFLVEAEALAEATEGGLALGLAVPALPAEAGADLCIDPKDPLSDQALADHRSAIALVVEEHPLVAQVHTAFGEDPTPWSLPCTCEACGEPDEAGYGGRLSALYEVLAEGVADSQAQPWLWTASPDDVSPDGPSALTAALGRRAGDSALALRLSQARSGTSPWAPLHPHFAEATGRSAALDLDLAGAHQPGRGLPLLWPDALQDTLRRAGNQGVSEWVARIETPEQSSLGSLREGMLDVLNGLYHDLEAQPGDLVAAACARIWSVDTASPEGTALAEALRHTGEAIDRSTHPLGFAVDSEAGALPSAFPFTYNDHSQDDEDWAARWASLAAPETNALIEVHQWLLEGEDQAAEALEHFGEAEAALDTEDAAELRVGFELLALTTSAWRAAIDADILLRAWDLSPQESYAEWLRHDAAALNATAEALEAGPSVGSWPAGQPVAAETLGSLAAAILNRVGNGTTNERPFPRITGLERTLAGDEVLVSWTLQPAGAGWLEMGEAWPLYPEASALGEGPAVQWNAWIPVTDADERITLRACGEVDGTRVCSGDHVAWTAP